MMPILPVAAGDELGPEWHEGLLPFDQDAGETLEPIPDGILGGAPIAYVGQAFSPNEFRAYVQHLVFPNPPAWLVIHHTSIPSASWAPAGSGAVWDAKETSLSEPQIRAKRLRQLRAIFDYYQNRLGWRAGPQLFIDDRWIYVGSPLTQEGIHAAQGNGVGTGARRRFSLGVEVIGHYERVAWPEPVMQNVAWAAAVLRERLETFAFVSQPGPGGVAEHRMYNKPQCPGAAVRASTYLPRFEQAYAQLRGRGTPAGGAPGAQLPPGSVPVDPRFAAAHAASGGIWQPGRLTPGYAVAQAEELPGGEVLQRFERGIARLQPDGVSWLRLDEAAALQKRRRA